MLQEMLPDTEVARSTSPQRTASRSQRMSSRTCGRRTAASSGGRSAPRPANGCPRGVPDADGLWHRMFSAVTVQWRRASRRHRLRSTIIGHRSSPTAPRQMRRPSRRSWLASSGSTARSSCRAGMNSRRWSAAPRAQSRGMMGCATGDGLPMQTRSRRCTAVRWLFGGALSRFSGSTRQSLCLSTRPPWARMNLKTAPALHRTDHSGWSTRARS